MLFTHSNDYLQRLAGCNALHYFAVNNKLISGILMTVIVLVLAYG